MSDDTKRPDGWDPAWDLKPGEGPPSDEYCEWYAREAVRLLASAGVRSWFACALSVGPTSAPCRRLLGHSGPCLAMAKEEE